MADRKDVFVPPGLAHRWPPPTPFALVRYRMRELLVFNSVQLNSVGAGAGRNVGKVFGAVWIQEYLQPRQYIYRRPRNNPETVAVGGHLTLTLPAIPVCGEDDFTIFIDLCDAADDDRSIVKKYISWRGWRGRFNKTSSSMMGRVTVNYLMTFSAMMAHIGVRFITKSTEKYFVTGSIVAGRVLNEFRPRQKITLFERSEDEFMEVAGDSVPLSNHHLVIQRPRKTPSLKIYVRLNGYVQGTDGEVVFFNQIQRDLDYYLNVDEYQLRARIFYIPIKYHTCSNKFSRFLQFLVTLY